jgi:hypothetical protein
MIEQQLAFATRCPSGVYLAPIIESIQSVNGNMSHRVRVLIKILADRDRVCDALLHEIPTSSISFDSLEWHQNRKGPVEGVVIVDDAVGSDLAEKLSSDIDALAAYQVQSNNVDYHPDLNEIVHDLVHPGLYSYVKGVTPVQAFNECIPTELQEDVKKDFWGQQYEDSVYQWLPTYLSILQDGKCIIQDYINNLTPREQPVNSNLYDRGSSPNPNCQKPQIPKRVRKLQLLRKRPIAYGRRSGHPSQKWRSADRSIVTPP